VRGDVQVLLTAPARHKNIHLAHCRSKVDCRHHTTSLLPTPLLSKMLAARWSKGMASLTHYNFIEHVMPLL
jgi:hypothetical protein